MNLLRFTSIFASLAVVVAMGQAQASSPNYGNVLHQAQEAKSACVAALPIAFSVPNTYQSLRAAIYNRFNYMRSLSQQIALLTPQGDAKRAEMLVLANKLKNEQKVVENLIEQLKDKADDADDDSTEDKAKDLRQLVNKVQGRAHTLVNMLD